MPCSVLRMIISAPWKQNSVLMMPRYCTDSSSSCAACAPSTSVLSGRLSSAIAAHAATQYVHWIVRPARMPSRMRSGRFAPSFCPA